VASVRLESVTKSFGSVVAIDNLSLEINNGEFFVLLGPTGAGKTTTLNVVAGLEKPESGNVFIDNEPVNEVNPADRDVAFVFQYYSLYPNYTVRQNLEFPLKAPVRKLSAEEICRKVEEVSQILRIDHLLGRRADKLSGGEMQRVSIGRAIVRNPRVFLMDEPLSNLDAKLREEMRAELKRLQMDMGSTILYVTHDQVEAMSMGDRIAVLNKGKILQIDKPLEVYNHPQNLFVARFVGTPTINVLTAQVEDGRCIIGDTAFEYSLQIERARGLRSVYLGVRAEDIVVNKGPALCDAILGEVYVVENMGEEDIVQVRAASMLIKAFAPIDLNFRIGDRVGLRFNREKVLFFDCNTEERIA
jgi:multiple sugar transport system ATP-binding protein